MQTHVRALVVHSPASGRASLLPQALNDLQQAGNQVAQTLPIADLPWKPAQGSAWEERGIQVVVAAGGDGTIGSVINHIVGSGLLLGIMPLGTSNNLARSLGIPLETSAAARTIAAGQVRQVDLGGARPLVSTTTLAEPVPQNVSPVYGYFAHVLTLGLNVQFARIATNVVTRKRYGRLTYPMAALEVLYHPEVLPVHLQFEGLQMPPHVGRQRRSPSKIQPGHGTLNCQALQVTIINAPLFGGAWELALPGSSLEDGVLDIVVFEGKGLSRMTARLASFFNSPSVDIDMSEENDAVREFIRHPAELTGLPGLHHLQARGIALTTEQDPQPVTLDGEIRGQTPLYVDLLKNSVSVLVPNKANTAE